MANSNSSSLESPLSSNAPAPRPAPGNRAYTAPDKMAVNGHFASVGQNGDANYENGVQVIDENKEFNPDLAKYLNYTGVSHAGFNYHLISVFGSQSTGKSTLLNALFQTDFSVMSESERRQTTKGIWLAKNKSSSTKMADNILVMDVEGTDGRERGEDQDFERKSSLFALATSEVLMVNIWEHQVGLYQGANMGLLKTVFEVNLQLFLKDRKSTSRSLLYFVIRDFLGTTPLQNLRNTLMQDMGRIWSSLSKPPGLENSSIDDYFDFAFTALPHKLYQPDQFRAEVAKMATRFNEGRRDPRRDALLGEFEGGIFLPEYHRRIPADGFSHYAQGIWDQIVNNKDLDLPTQQELLAQFRCDEIMREVMVDFDVAITPLETKQAEATKMGKPEVLPGLGAAMKAARSEAFKNFETEASRYHKGVYQRKRTELESKIDSRLKALFASQLTAAHKDGVQQFSDAVSSAVKTGQKKGSSYDFAEIVKEQKEIALEKFDAHAKEAVIEGLPWSSYKQDLALYQKELDKVSGQLRRDEMRRLATRVERWVRSKLSDSIGLEFNALGSGHSGSRAPETGDKPSETEIWDRIWALFTSTVQEAEKRFADRAASFDASAEEVEVGIWRLRRKSWGVLRAKIDEEMMEGNLLLKLRENFEDKFRYDEAGVPRIWRPTDDIEGIYTKARESTLTLIPLLSRFRLSETGAPPPLDRWIGPTPAAATSADEEDLVPIGGVDEDEGKSLEEETTILNEAKRQDLTVRFKKAADGVYVEAKRSAIGGMTQVPLYFYGLLLALGWNEIVAVLRNPVYFIFLILVAIGAYVTYTLNLWGPMYKMANAASQQALEEGKKRLREFLEESPTARHAVAMTTGNEEYEMKSMGGSSLSSKSKLKTDGANDEDDVEDI
ncbi:Dynamin-like GTPase that mediates homotypic ER fusion [Exophiala dermatitidis]|uniref:Protein sey1 n=2 Tax=Exophiala dermatitidis TaxID=5970 RepID=H6BV69_EXODN|nr:protein sey1 [Exophiala dermatitidis NIH/UT8656]KAJ4508667.1 Dynamin-like GTPase that mediates homotypic ER fusion [Exophiala dermatitidis]EHY54983.1 protein sey1 [Exophiala dermatitidis NIH/UT8656]KAJ4510918.1 Dynamin-like GTPase that mediates homotypic ER fusion [Exophiala dermatitidis]KAJ4513315.1 Dynamin-like GTPase that mediates homotypic ER fusion [Exophiala dermatitidis]KAJ4538134.1 Dynamin-like GTPase that mediates homotypic ER fusion [Exophiala dermatitidis]